MWLQSHQESWRTKEGDDFRTASVDTLRIRCFFRSAWFMCTGLCSVSSDGVGHEMSFTTWTHLGINEVKYNTCIIFVPYVRQNSKNGKDTALMLKVICLMIKCGWLHSLFFEALGFLISSSCHQHSSLTQLNRWEAFKTWLSLLAYSSLGACLGEKGPWIFPCVWNARTLSLTSRAEITKIQSNRS